METKYITLEIQHFADGTANKARHSERCRSKVLHIMRRRLPYRPATVYGYGHDYRRFRT